MQVVEYRVGIINTVGVGGKLISFFFRKMRCGILDVCIGGIHVIFEFENKIPLHFTQPVALLQKICRMIGHWNKLNRNTGLKLHKAVLKHICSSPAERHRDMSSWNFSSSSQHRRPIQILYSLKTNDERPKIVAYMKSSCNSTSYTMFQWLYIIDLNIFISKIC